MQDSKPMKHSTCLTNPYFPHPHINYYFTFNMVFVVKHSMRAIILDGDHQMKEFQF